MSYEFICPKCGDNTIEEVQYGYNRYAYVTVENYGSGPELYEEDHVEYYDTPESRTIWRCASCEWELPCKTPNEVVDYVVDQEVERRT